MNNSQERKLKNSSKADLNRDGANFYISSKNLVDSIKIKTTLEGGLDFNATEIYVNNLKKVIDEHTSNL